MASPEIILQGDALVADIDAATVQGGEFALWWLGQHSFIIKAGSAIVYIDPFLTPMPERLCPPLLTPEQLKHATLVCGTHDHLDHIDRGVWPAIAAAGPEIRFVVPQCVLDRGLAEDLSIPNERFIGLDDGRHITVDSPHHSALRAPHSALPIRISAVAASHEFLDREPVTGRYPYLGFIFEINGVTLYHAGDTVWYEGLQTKLRKWNFDAMLVPINGRDANRLRQSIFGNMTYQEAADLCGPLLSGCLGGSGGGVVIPAHYDMFAGNPGDVAGFLDYMAVKYPAVHAMRCRYGERVMIRRR